MKTWKRPASLRKLWRGVLAAALLLPGAALAKTWYVAPTGSDSNAGNLTAPFATITQAQTAASSGDTVYLRGGNYTLTDSNITSYQDGNVYATVNTITKNNISYLAYPGDGRPVFNFTAVKPTGYRNAAFWVTASNVTFQGFDVVGVQITITGSNNQSIGFAIYGGSNCTWNQVSVHDGMCVGFYVEKASANNLFYQCDSYNNTGLDSYSYGNADGFGCHPAAGGTGNVFRQCRSWNNSDDGYDCINASETVTFDHCWSYLNGNNGGNGNSFKVGGWGSTAQNAIRNPLPAHIVKYCLSANNGSHGFYANHQPGQAATWTYNTGYNDHTDFDMLERTAPVYTNSTAQTDSNDISGVAEVMHFNLAYVGTLTNDLNETGGNVSNNTWTLPVTVNSADFQSTDATQMTQARQADGSLPVITFMHLVSGSDCAGLGCFESAPLNPSATAGSATVALTWTSVLGATSYVVNRSTTNSGNYTAVTGNLSTNSYSDTAVTNGVTYYYVVSATNGGDVSGNSTQASATPLGTPTGLTATPGSGNVTLNWSTAAGATSYTVQRSTTNGSGYTTVATNVSATTYKDTTAANGTTYYYVVVATNSSGSSGDSVQASGTPQPPAPATPTGLAATAGNGNVTLNWTASSGATSYIVQRSTTSGSGYAIINGAVGTNAYSDTGLINGTTYYYVVAAANGGGDSANSAEVSAMPAATLTQWASAAFGNSTNANLTAPPANPAGDGIPNLLKYFYGLDPATNSGTPPVSTVPDNSGNLVLTFRLAKNLTGVTYQIQSSPDLLNWTNTGVQGTEVSDQGAYYLMQAAVPMSANAKLYLRVTVTQL